jgi:hypothetical protein
MIRSEAELDEIRAKLREQDARLAAYRAELQRDGLPTADVERALEPIRSFAAQLRESIAAYERFRRGKLPSILSLEEIGPALVASRIAAGVTQRELATRLGVHESQVSRDEKTGYQGVTVERASKILAAMGVGLRATFVLEQDQATGEAR